MTLFAAFLLTLLVGCEAAVDYSPTTPPQWASMPTHTWTSIPSTTTIDMVTYKDDGPSQEDLGRVLVMTARGWDRWPAAFRFCSDDALISVQMTALRSGTTYEIIVREVGR